MSNLQAVSGSFAEDLFIELFSDVFGAEKADFYIRNITFTTFTKTTDTLISFYKTVLAKSPLK